MLGTLLKYLFSGVLIVALFVALKQSGQLAAITTQVGHIRTAFDFVNGNIKNMSATFPWMIDVVVMFGAVITIEAIIVLWKIANFISKKAGH